MLVFIFMKMLLIIIIGLLSLLILILLTIWIFSNNKHRGGDSGLKQKDFTISTKMGNPDKKLLSSFICHNSSFRLYMFWFCPEILGNDEYQKLYIYTWKDYFDNIAKLDGYKKYSEYKDVNKSILIKQLENDKEDKLLSYINKHYEHFLRKPFIKELIKAFEYEKVNYYWNDELNPNITAIDKYITYEEFKQNYENKIKRKIDDPKYGTDPHNYILRFEDVTRGIYKYLINHIYYGTTIEYNNERYNIVNDDFVVCHTVNNRTYIAPYHIVVDENLDTLYGNDGYIHEKGRFDNKHEIHDIYKYNRENDKRCIISYSNTCASYPMSYIQLYNYFFNCCVAALQQKTIKEQYTGDYLYFNASFIYSMVYGVKITDIKKIETSTWYKDQISLLKCVFDPSCKFNHDDYNNKYYNTTIDTTLKLYEPLFYWYIDETYKREYVIVKCLLLSDTDITMWANDMFIDAETDENGTYMKKPINIKKDQDKFIPNYREFWFAKYTNATKTHFDKKNAATNKHFMKSLISVLTKLSYYAPNKVDENKNGQKRVSSITTRLIIDYF